MSGRPFGGTEPEAGELLALPCVCADIRRLSRLVTRLYDAELRESGLEVTQFGVLSALHHRGEMSHGQLAAGFGMDGTTLTRTVGVLERRGLLTRRPGADRRQRVYSISPEGRAQLAAAHAGWQRAQNRVRAVVGDQALDAVMSAATTIGAKLAVKGRRGQVMNNASPLAPTPAARRHAVGPSPAGTRHRG